MPYFTTCSKIVIPFLKERNRELERPLSILLANARDVEHLVDWTPWIRRVAVFSDKNETYYYLVATATGLDFYSRFNFKMRGGSLSEIPLSEEITWPFDAINVTLNEEPWASDENEIEVWKSLFFKQARNVEDFLLIIQGKLSRVSESKKLLKQVEGKMQQTFVLTELEFKTFQSEGLPFACCIWSIGNQPTKVREQTTAEDQEAITELMLWGDES